MRSSKNSQEYALSVRCSDIAERILFDKQKNSRISSVICIASRKTMKDGLYQRGVSCGYDVAKRLFLLGTFEGCTCFETTELTEWSGIIHLKGKLAVFIKRFIEITLRAQHEVFTDIVEKHSSRLPSFSTYSLQNSLRIKALPQWKY